MTKLTRINQLATHLSSTNHRKTEIETVFGQTNQSYSSGSVYPLWDVCRLIKRSFGDETDGSRAPPLCRPIRAVGAASHCFRRLSGERSELS